MVKGVREGSVQFSVDISKISDRTSGPSREQLRTLETIRRKFADFGTPVTWFVPNASSPLTLWLVNNLGQDEIGWEPPVNPSVAPPRLLEIKETIQRELATFVAAGHPIQSVAIPESWARPQMLEWLADGGVDVLRGPLSTLPSQRLQPRMLRQDLWQVPVAATFPGHGRGIGLGVLDLGFLAKKALLRALQGDQAVHIAMLVNERTLATDRIWNSLSRLLQRVRHLQQAARLTCVTLRQTPGLFPGARETATRSILRAA